MFDVHPENQTVEYGSIVDFECRTQDCNTGLTLLAAGRDGHFQELIPTTSELTQNLIQTLDYREFNASTYGVIAKDVCKTKGKFWFVANNDRSLQLLNSFVCKGHSSNGSSALSSVAYISVTYQESCHPEALLSSNLSQQALN